MSDQSNTHHKNNSDTFGEFYYCILQTSIFTADFNLMFVSLQNSFNDETSYNYRERKYN